MAVFNPTELARAYRDPVSWVILAVDLFPVLAVLKLGWDATPLVFLYWIENLIIGLVTLLRMLAASSREGLNGLPGGVLLGAFFTVHYGMFCFVHGVFLMGFAAMSESGGIGTISGLDVLAFAFSTGKGMILFAGVILALQLFLFLRDFILRGAYRETEVAAEMAKPYGRVVVLHIALFAGFGLMVFLGEPLAGVLALILLRAAWGVLQSIQRNREITGSVVAQS